MAAYKRIYDTAVRDFLSKKGLAGTALIFGLFIFLASSGSITITGYSGNMTCAGTLEEPCLAYLNFSANKDIYIYPTNDSVWAFNASPPDLMKSVVMQRSWGSSWRTIDLSKAYSGAVKYAVKFSMGQNYSLRFIGYKNNINDTIKWSFGDKTFLFSDDSYVDPVWIGYSASDFFVRLVYNKADLGRGEAVFEIRNPTSFNIPVKSSYLSGYAINAMGPKIDRLEFYMNTSVFHFDNVTDYIDYIWNETVTGTNGTYDITHYDKNITGWHWSNYTVFEWKPISDFTFLKGEIRQVMVKGYWKIGLGTTNINLLIGLNVSGTKFEWG